MSYIGLFSIWRELESLCIVGSKIVLSPDRRDSKMVGDQSRLRIKSEHLDGCILCHGHSQPSAIGGELHFSSVARGITMETKIEPCMADDWREIYATGSNLVTIDSIRLPFIDSNPVIDPICVPDYC